MPRELAHLESIRRARTGDPRAWSALHAAWRPAVHAVAVAHGPHDAADDVVQETFARAMARIGDLRDDLAFGGWLLGIARNLAVDGFRRRRRFEALRDVFFARPRPSLEAARALAAIRALPEAYRELLTMRLVEEMTGPEIAEVLGRTPESVRVSLHRGMALLRAALEEGR